MPKLLYLAHPFPPARFVACIRSWNTAKQLSRLGWKVTVVTPHPSLWLRAEDPENAARAAAGAGLEVIHTGHRWAWLNTNDLRVSHPRFAWACGGPLRRALRGLGFEGHIGWAPAVETACADYQPGAFDAILATGNPWISFSLARTLGRWLRCPYVLDYRDLWTAGNHCEMATPRPWIRRWEQSIVGGAAAVTVVSEALAELLAQAFDIRKRLSVVSNGYDQAELARVQPGNFDEPAIVYAGGFYPPHRVLSPVFAALKALDGPELEWKFHYYGPNGAAAKQEAEQAGLQERLVTHGEVSRPQALSASKAAHVAVVVTSIEETASLSHRGILTGKIFELVGMGVPVLLVAPRGSDAEPVIRNCGRRFSGSQVSAMTQYLAELLRGPRQSHQPPAAFAWERLGGQFDQILKSLKGN